MCRNCNDLVSGDLKMVGILFLGCLTRLVMRFRFQTSGKGDLSGKKRAKKKGEEPKGERLIRKKV